MNKLLTLKCVMGLIERALEAVSLQTLHLTNGFCKKVSNHALMCQEVTVSKTSSWSYIFKIAYKKG